MLCIRGLGNVASLPEDQLRKHSTTVLSAMMNGMDDRNDPHDDITLEAMRGLSKIFAKVGHRLTRRLSFHSALLIVLCQVEEEAIRAILINISLRIRPCFSKVIAPSADTLSFDLLDSLCSRCSHNLRYAVLPWSSLVTCRALATGLPRCLSWNRWVWLGLGHAARYIDGWCVCGSRFIPT